MADFPNRPGGINETIVNGYCVVLRECHDRCGSMHGGGCTCGAEHDNRITIAEAKNKPPNNPPDKLQLSYNQLVEKITLAHEQLKNILVHHYYLCFFDIDFKNRKCICGAKAKNEQIQSVLYLLSLK